MWISVTFPKLVTVDRVEFDTGQFAEDFPERFTISGSRNGRTWMDLKKDAVGSRASSVDFAPTEVKAIKITATEAKIKWWTISSLDISGPGNSRPVQYPPERCHALTLADATKLEQSWGKSKQDTSVLDKPLRIAGKMYKTGIGAHSHSEITWNVVGKGYKRFVAECGMAEGSNNGSSRFQVFVNNRKVFESKDMTPADKAVPIDIELIAANTIRLVVTKGVDGDSNQDHANWINPCCVR